MMLFMLFMLFATALCEQPVPCYWQLSAVEVETSASDAFNTTASTDALPLSGLMAEECSAPCLPPLRSRQP